jgi:multiple sugar transport system ATP-binding protein
LWSAVAGRAPAGAERAGLRPEHLHLRRAGDGIAADVVLAEHLGDVTIVHLKVEGLGELLTAKVGPEHGPVDAGRTVGLAPDASWALAFGADGQLL